ncbi:dihydroneopterin aldolase [Neolewinella aurantiaca]|uniref:7,8-dihydroneopterin aldolase n=1 Tax=Neolewinella aurantiaca TaxID=2602767 RepID=A0A5C7FGD0_9BACT|nr:dihydroneopterin aldolase [Neolewinella aurantiaca]TXF89399.1 dihydroneopterin aldolase [Neolewinella aurantiaca]
MTAKIGLEDVRIHAPHGFFEEEHLMGNEFSIDVEVEASIAGAAQNDDLGGTVNYATIYYLIQAEMKKPTQLLEALAYRMGNRILNQFDTVSSVKLRLRKLNPPLGGKVGAAVVEVSLGASSAGGFGGGSSARQDTYEDPGGFDDDDFGSPAGGGFGGGFSGGGISGFIQKPPPTMPVFDEAAFSDMDDEEDWDDDEEFDDDEPEFDIPDAGEIDDDEDGFEDFSDDDFDDMDFDDDMDFGDLDLGDLDLGDFDINDFK